MDLISLLVTLIVYGLIFYVLYWALGAVGLPEPFGKVANVILILASVLVLLGIVTGSVHTFSFPGTVRL